MNKKSTAIILAAIGLSAGSTLAMEHVPNKATQCAKILDTNTLYKFFFNGEALMPGTDQNFMFSSEGNKLQYLIQKATKDKKMESKRVGLLENVTQDGNRVVCHYTYSTDPNSEIKDDNKFTVTSMSKGTENLPQMQPTDGAFSITQMQKKQYDDLMEKNQVEQALITLKNLGFNPDDIEEPVFITEEEYIALMTQEQWEEALKDLGIAANFNYNDQNAIQSAFENCKKGAGNNKENLDKCQNAKKRVNRGMFEWRNYILKKSRLVIITK